MKRSEINQLITTNSNCFKPGSVIIDSTLCAWFSIPKPHSNDYHTMQRFTLHKCDAYRDLNRVLALRGLVIKSKNYYTEFHVQTVPNTVKYVKAKAKCGTKAIKTSATISNNMVIHGSVWTQLTLDELASVRKK